MQEKKYLLNKTIINCLNTDYAIKVVKLTPLLLGADIQASVYKAEAQDQSSYFVKLKQGNGHGDDDDISASSSIMMLLQDAGIQPIIPLVKTTHGKSFLNFEDFTFLVYPFIEGQDGFSRDLTETQWVTLGQALRQVHEIKVPQALQSKIQRERYSSKWREIVLSLYAYIDSEPSGDEVALKLLLFMKEHRSDIYRLVERAEQLAQHILKQAGNYVLCHSDIHAGNVFIDNKSDIYIVDWDAPIMAPKERDLMFIGGGVANVWNKPDEVALFYKGYGYTEIDQTRLAYYRHERIVQDIAEYGQQLLLSTHGGEDRIVWYQDFINQFDPQGVVEIAFKTEITSLF